MIIKKKNIYYCEFCKKKGLSASHISRHEKYCTANPNRKCRLCGRKSIKDIIEKYTGIYKIEWEHIGADAFIESYDRPNVIWLEDLTIEDLITDVEGCPNCTLTILRVCKISSQMLMALGIWEEERFDFDYKKELQEWWDAVNTEEYQKELDCYRYL